MHRKSYILVGILAAVFLLSGCASTRKQRNEEIQGLKNQISVLEAQVQSKDEEINSLKDSLSRAPSTTVIETIVKTKKKVIPEIKSRPKIKQVQIALKNAGYNPGPADGRMGKQTRDAVEAFQRANNLHVDGRVGKKTWSLLKEYLYKKAK